MRLTAPTNRPVCRIGFVGTGGVATRHAHVLSTFDDVALVAATDVDPSRAAAFAAEFGVTTADGVDGLLAHDLHAVYVCVPPFAHGPADTSAEARLAAAGVAVFVEKPLAVDLDTAEAVGVHLSRAGVLTRVGHHWRCAEPIARARELLAGRTPRLVSAAWWDKVPPVPWWADRARSGGPVVEQAVHVLDLLRLLVGEVEHVHARSAGSVPGGGDADAAVAALLSFRGGAVGTLSTTSVLGWKHRAGIEVVADGLVVGVGEDWLEVHDGSAAPRRGTFDRMTACTAADRAFVDAVAERAAGPERSASGHALPDYAEALRTHRLATAVARSAASGVPETV
jgi:myo-inositol 2-dehydrogenase / D-chiro-inositol 1-dehydrogenase